MIKTVRNTTGNVLLQILAATAVMSTSFYFLTNYVIGQKQQVGKTMNLVNVQFAMNSTMDYLIFGVRQKYCFTNDDLLMNSSPSDCNLSHAGSVERLIMSPEQENFIRQLIANGTNVGPVDSKKIRLSSIKSYLSVGSVTTSHPLFPVIQSLRKVKADNGNAQTVDGIEVELTRDDSVFLPRAGREVYIKLKVALKGKKADEKPLYFGATPLTITSQVIIYPREVGSFALLVPNDLYLDRSWDAAVNPGDVSLHKFTSRSELGTSAGLVFQSPVFVNRNVHLPVDNYSDSVSSDSINYSPVTFADRLYLGNGWVYSNNRPFTPRSSGGKTDRFWSDARTFGGFLKGIENDGGADLGLQYFAKIKSGAAPDTGLMAKCIERAQSLASKESLYKSGLGATLKESSGNSFKYRLYLSDQNSFEGQDSASTLKKTNWGTGDAQMDTSYNNSVLKVKFSIGDRAVEGEMAREGKLVLTPQVGSTTLADRYATAVRTAESAYNTELADYASLEEELEEAREDLSEAREKLEDEQDKPVRSTSSTEASTTTQSSSTTESSTTTETSTTSTSTSSDSTSSESRSGRSRNRVDYQDPDKIEKLEDEIEKLEAKISRLSGTKLPAQQTEVSTALATLDAAKTDKNAYEALVANPPKITIETTKVVNRKDQTTKGKINFKVTYENVKSLIDKNGDYKNPVIAVQAYDGTYYNAEPVSSPANNKLGGYLNFRIAEDKLSIIAPDYLSTTSDGSSVSTLREDDTDYAALDAQCEEARNAQPSQSFGSAGWDVSFAETTRTSWNFAGGTEVGKDPGLAKLELFGLDRSNATFQVRSIVGKCIINETTTFVTGFFTCDELEITTRSQPLRIIGTFIVGKMKIAPEALKAGITWSAIYHPQATRELRAAGPTGENVLRSFSGRDCNSSSADPIWHPIPSVQEVSDRRGCNTISLRAKADPFQWTAMDPDCGIAKGSTASNTSCKRRLIRFFVVEQSRESGL